MPNFVVLRNFYPDIPRSYRVLDAAAAERVVLPSVVAGLAADESGRFLAVLSAPRNTGTIRSSN